jgi:5-methylcytosine-specific restriction protein A
VPRALKVCSTPGCPNLVPGGRCPACIAAAEAARGTSRQRGYDHHHETRFRPGVLRRDPLCVCTTTSHGHGAPCLTPSLHADHHPRTRRELVALGLDPNDPTHGRGLCERCHNAHTAATSPGGWHAGYRQ